MEEDAIALNDIVITGYQKLSKERATGSFSVICSEDINKKHHTNLMQRIEGMSTGLTNYKGDIKIRGIATINGNNQPLYVVDGVPYEGSLDAINHQK
jgi:TonB-dependent Receptor Plug Domain.